MSIHEIIYQLQETPSTLQKEAILNEHKTNAELRTFMYLALENKVNFFVKKIPSYTPTGGMLLGDAMQHLMQLANRTHTGNQAIGFLKNLLSSLSVDDAKMLERIINKNPKCGCATTIVNKVWPNLVTDVPYMRCSLLKDSNIEKFDWINGVYSQLKADGMYSNLTVNDITSRNGSTFPIDQFGDVIATLRQCGAVIEQFHGEFVVEKDGVLLTRKESNGIMNSVLHGDTFPEGHNPVFFVWDTIPLSESRAKNKYRVPYKERFAKINNMFGSLSPNSCVRIIETRIVHSYEDAYTHFREIRRKKLEGTIIKSMGMIWEDTTSKDQIKMKEEVDVDLKIVGFNDAAKTSRHVDLFGSLQLETEDGLLSVAATGISDDERARMHTIKDQLIGKVITVTSNELFEPSKNNKFYSLFLPRLVEIREDKSVADTLQQVKDQFEAALKS